jgi:hypothetical protein
MQSGSTTLVHVTENTANELILGILMEVANQKNCKSTCQGSAIKIFFNFVIFITAFLSFYQEKLMKCLLKVG